MRTINYPEVIKEGVERRLARLLQRLGGGDTTAAQRPRVGLPVRGPVPVH
jgi:hypothetical protein